MLEELKELVAESLGAYIEDLTEETSFTEDLGADSLDLFEMVMEWKYRLFWKNSRGWIRRN